MRKNNPLSTHYQKTNLRLVQTERVCRRQFKFDENGRKLSKQIEKTLGKGEIARYVQFLLFPQCFPKVFFFFPQWHQKVSLCGNGLRLTLLVWRNTAGHVSILCPPWASYFMYPAFFFALVYND